MAKFIRFSALPFISISLSNSLAFFFRFVSRLIDFSFYVPFSWLLYTQSYPFSSAHFFTLLHMQVNLPHSSCYFYLFCFNLGTFPSVRKVSNRSFLTQILSRSISCYFFSFFHAQNRRNSAPPGGLLGCAELFPPTISGIYFFKLIYLNGATNDSCDSFCLLLLSRALNQYFTNFFSIFAYF